MRRQIQLAVKSECETILITGETGTGKEIVAREIHFLSGNEENGCIMILKALEKARRNRRMAAKDLKIPYSTLFRKLY